MHLRRILQHCAHAGIAAVLAAAAIQAAAPAEAHAAEIASSKDVRFVEELGEQLCAGATMIDYSAYGFGQEHVLSLVEYAFAFEPGGYAVKENNGFKSFKLDPENKILLFAYKPGAKRMRADVEGQLDEALNWAKAAKGKAQQAKAVHDWLVRNCRYNTKLVSTSTTWLHNEYGALVKKKPVCQGYALAFKMAMDRLGIENDVVHTDNSVGGGHMWNRIKVGGAWYNVDVTSDDPVVDAGTGKDLGYNGRVLSTYFMVSDSFIKKTDKQRGSTLHSEMISVFANSKAKSKKYDGKSSWAAYPKLKKGQRFAVSGAVYEVRGAKSCRLAKAPAGKSSFSLPATCSFFGTRLSVTGIAPKAFEGSKAKTLGIRTLKLTKASVAGSLAGSKVTKVKVAAGSKASRAAYRSKYAAYFKKANSGKDVKVL